MVAGVKDAFHLSNPSNAADAVWAADIEEKSKSAKADRTELVIEDLAGIINDGRVADRPQVFPGPTLHDREYLRVVLHPV
jgi:hypothetical protein